MKLKNVKRGAIVFAVSASFILPQVPQISFAKGGSTLLALDLFSDSNDTGLFPTTPSVGSSSSTNTGSGSTPRNTTPTRPATRPTTAGSMSVARVPEAYSCPLFDNRPHAELIAAIDSLNKEVKAAPECAGTPSAKTLEENGNAIKENIAALQKLMAAQDATQVNTGQIDQSMTAALAAVGNLGDILNNNSFLSSRCGRQTMSTGKVLLALNDVINGLAPYALFAVSMNAALAPALPFVIGGTIATSGISAITKMIDQNTLDMNNPEHRKAVLQNTCQYTKVAKKVRFMQLAQSGKIERITQELEQTVDLYNTRFGTPTRELSALLKYRDTALRTSSALEKQLLADKADLQGVEAQVSTNSDDLLMCTLSNELVNWARDGQTFPASVFNNFEAATAQSERSIKLQALTMKSLNVSSMKRIADAATKASDDETALRQCAQAGRSWLAGIRQTISLTEAIVGKSKVELESELTRNAEYRQWKAQYLRIEQQKVTIKRVEKAMQELAKDNSIIDRSELAQRMVNLKSGLFGSKSAWTFGKPPVLAWIEHTKKIHDQAISAFNASLKAVRDGSYSLTRAGRGEAGVITPLGGYYIDPKIEAESIQTAKTLSNLNLKEIPMGSREHEIICQQLESAWIDWSSAIDHLGAIQFFCDMIDPILDIKMDDAVIKACRGNVHLNGNTYQKSVINQAKEILVKRGFQSAANVVSQKMKALQCPMPAVSVMNQ